MISYLLFISLGAALKVGEVNLGVMALLDKANTTTYGHPEPTNVLWSGIEGYKYINWI
jgi:hydroxylamine reductase